MKGIKSKIVSNNASEIDSYDLPHVTKNSIIDEQLSNILDKELSNGSHNKVRKIVQELKIRFISRYSLSNKKNDAAHESFTKNGMTHRKARTDIKLT